MKRTDVRVALVFKDFAAWIRTSCVGLNVAGYTTEKVLNQHGFETVVFPVRHNVDVVKSIDRFNETHNKKLTHVVISAPWLSIHDLKSLLHNFPTIQFVILSHSNVGFLQADPYGVHLLREYQELSKSCPNFKVGGNSRKFVEWMEHAYGRDVVLLPNMYPIGDPIEKKWDGVSPIKIGAFGAVRPEKNFMTAAAAAVALQSSLGVPVELHMSTGGEGDRGLTSPAIDQMCFGKVRVIRHPWMFWDGFIQLVASMDLLIQVSYTESFNMITADGISVGVPSVVSPAIYWAPNSWKADSDNVMDVVKVGRQLLLNAEIRNLGVEALTSHNEESMKHWERYLTGEHKRPWWNLF
jgi:hypothetical protein